MARSLKKSTRKLKSTRIEYKGNLVTPLDLRIIPSDDRYPIKPKNIEKIYDYLQTATGNQQEFDIDPIKKTVKIATMIGDKKVWSGEYLIKDLVPEVRTYHHNRVIVEEKREKYGLVGESYNLKDIGQIHQLESKGKGPHGLKNINRSTTKRIKEGRYEIAADNKEVLRAAKVRAFEDADEIMKSMNIDVSKYKWKNGKFKSAKAEREYNRDFALIIMDEYEHSSEEMFYAWLFENDLNYHMTQDMEAISRYNEDIMAKGGTKKDLIYAPTPREYAETIGREKLDELVYDYLVDIIDAKDTQEEAIDENFDRDDSWINKLRKDIK